MADIATFRDDFSDGSLNPEWSSSPATGSTITESGGTLNIAMPTTSGAISSVITTTGYNFIGSQAIVEMLDYPAATNRLVSFQIYQDATHRYLIQVNGSNLQAYRANNAAVTQVGSNLTYSSTNHRWWRIRESGGTVYYDTAPDGVTWTNRWSVARGAATGWDHTTLNIRLVAQNGTLIAAWTATFDNIGGPAPADGSATLTHSATLTTDPVVVVDGAAAITHAATLTTDPELITPGVADAFALMEHTALLTVTPLTITDGAVTALHSADFDLYIPPGLATVDLALAVRDEVTLALAVQQAVTLALALSGSVDLTLEKGA